MRLATRCPSCTTMFLVVEDQLRVSDGWVRCGRCANVFNAVEDLLDVASGEPVKIDLGSLQAGTRLTDSGLGMTDAEAAFAPPRSAAPATPSLRPSSHSASMPLDDLPEHLLRAPSEPDEAPAMAAPAPPAPPQAILPPPPASQPPSGPATAPAPDSTTHWPTEVSADAAGDTVAVRADEAESTDTRAGLAWDAPASTPAAADAPAAAAAQGPAAEAESILVAPSFLRRAEQADRWRRSPLRWGLGALAAGLGLLLLAQMALWWRDPLAAHVRATAPALQSLCGLLGCQVQPLRRIDQLAVDSSGLTKLDDPTAGPGQRYRLSVQLRNKADTAVMAPALELTLSDVQGETVVRRVLKLSDFGVAAEVLTAGQELPLRLQLATGERRVEGYTVELFYP